MNKNLTQYGTIFDAAGVTLRYESKSASLAIIEAPKGVKTVVKDTLEEIKHFDDTTNYVDGMAALCVADYVDTEPNPLSEDIRMNILESLGLMTGGKYIHQVLMLQKNNRSWHYSDVANECSHFGEECTHRGVNPNPDRKGRRSSRQPSDYHVMNGKGEINREQLVTENLEQLFQSISSESLVSGRHPSSIEAIALREFKKLPAERRLEFIEQLQKVS